MVFAFGQNKPATSLFGASAPTSTGFSFGATPATSAPASTGFSFGATPATSAPASTGFSFGATPASSAGNFSFGGSTTAPATSGFSFGAATPAANTSLFGSSTTQPSATSSLLGGGTNLFGAPSTSTPAVGSLFAGSTPAPQQQPPAVSGWQAEAQAIMSAYDTNSSNCRFQYVLYNRVDPSSQQPQQLSPEFHLHHALYQQAIRDNPDPEHLVPVPALGFTALQKRIEQQNMARQHHLRELEICKETISKLEGEHSVIMNIKIPQYRHKHAELAIRLLRVAKQLDIQQGQGFPRSDSEIRLEKDLDALERLIEKQRVNVESIASGVPIADDMSADRMRFNELDPNHKRIYEFLDQQRQALQHIVALLTKDIRDCTIMSEGYTQKLNPARISM